MSDNTYKEVKLKYGIARTDPSQLMPDATPKKDEAKHQGNVKLSDLEVPKLQTVAKIKPDKASQKEKKTAKIDIKSLDATSKKCIQAMGKKLEGPELVNQFQRTSKTNTKKLEKGADSKKNSSQQITPKKGEAKHQKNYELFYPDKLSLQIKSEIKTGRAPKNKCHPECTQEMGKTLEGPELVNQFQRTSKTNIKKLEKGADSKKESSQQTTPKKAENKHHTNFELFYPDMPTSQRKPGKAPPKERNRKTNSESIFEAKTATKRKQDVKLLGAASKKGKKSELPRLQREDNLKPLKEPENKCHPVCTLAMGKTFEGPRYVHLFERRSKKDVRDKSSTSKAIKKTDNKHKKSADSKKDSVTSNQMKPNETQQVDELMKYMYEAMRAGCQPSKPKEK